MRKEQIDYNELEKLVDAWIPQLLNKEIPRYSFIFTVIVHMLML